MDYCVNVLLLPTKICLFKVNNRNTTKRCDKCSKLTIKTSKRPHFTPFSGVSTVDFEQGNVYWVGILMNIN